MTGSRASSPGRPPVVQERCESVSPIAKFDGGPVHCERAKGHSGLHWGKNYDVSYEAAPCGYQTRAWDDDGNFVS